MKIGILTYHSQLNYGGVLQAVASYTYLKKQGHDAVVVDRWLSANNSVLKGFFAAPKTIRERVKDVLYLCVFETFLRGEFRHWLRIYRTCRFLTENIVRTKRHFVKWDELQNEPLEFDALYVGSDQVWNCSWGSPAVYLLEGLTRKIPAISYAASIGRTTIPEEYKALYRRGLARFSSISVREKSAKELIENLLTTKIAHVVDPVLLLDRSDWETIAGTQACEGDFIFCYILRENMADILPKIIAFSNRHRVKVKVYGHGPYLPFSKHHPFKSFIKNWALNFKLWFSRVSVCLSSGPKEFVRDIATAKGVVTDSFHATMFSAIFDKNVRVIRPNNETAAEMFSRMDEFAADYTTGDIFADTLDDAFRKILESPRTLRYDYAQLGLWQSASRAWLVNAIGGVA